MDEAAPPDSSLDNVDKLVYLEYVLIFNPKETWGSLRDFEQDFTDFFAAYGFETKGLLTATGEASGGKKVLYITQSQLLQRPVMQAEVQTEDKSKSTKQILAQMRQKRGFDGKYKGVNK